MLTGNMSEETQDKIRACGVDVRPIPDELSGQRIINIRWKIYYDFLKDNTDKYDMVLTADVRDVIFQRDLFKLCDSSKPLLGIALEDFTIGEDSQNNAKWIINAYGNDIYQELKDNTIICVGTVWGTTEEFMNYSSVMSDILNSEWSLRLHVIEQGIGNYIIYHDKMFADVISTSTNYDGYVMTIGLTAAKEINVDSNGNFLNGKGEIAAVVHQYDRKPEAINIVSKKYCADMSLFAKLSLRHNCDGLGKVMRFLSRVHRRCLFRSVYEAIKRRI
ncbi:MAG: hypothetical protein IJR85_08685 [Synergistaceae bacterium]|nr:hypothetical protein [Synergistaceae bacterium]